MRQYLFTQSLLIMVQFSRICILRLRYRAICAITLSEAQWFCCQKVPPLSWCRALPLLLVLSPPTSADSPAGGASSPQQLPLVGSVEVVQLLQQPSLSRPHNGLWSATAQYVSAPIAAGETQEGQYCKSALHLNSKVTPETQWRTHCSRMHNSFLQKGTLHCFRHKVERHSMRRDTNQCIVVTGRPVHSHLFIIDQCTAVFELEQCTAAFKCALNAGCN